MPGLISRDISSTVNYYDGTKDGEEPYHYTYTPPPGVPQTNTLSLTQQVPIYDARGREDEVGLDKTGFTFVNSPSQEKAFEDEDAIKTGYYNEVIELVKKVTGARRVVIFDHTIRKQKHDEPPNPNKPPQRGPVDRVHIDQTFESAIDRVRVHMGDESDELLKDRVRIINIWRPIANTVAHRPLGLADYRTLDVAKDLVSTKHIAVNRDGATFSVHYNPAHRWYYLSDQTTDEVTFIKCFDSVETVARLTPHTAITDTTSPPEAPQRQSIEVRCLVFG